VCVSIYIYIYIYTHARVLYSRINMLKYTEIKIYRSNKKIKIPTRIKLTILLQIHIIFILVIVTQVNF